MPAPAGMTQCLVRRTSGCQASISFTSPSSARSLPYWPLYLESLNFNPFQIGVLMSLYLATRIVAPAFWGRLTDARGNAVSVVQRAAGLSLLTYAAVFFGQSFVFLFVVIALMSFFWSAQMPLIEAITLTHLKEQTERYGH